MKYKHKEYKVVEEYFDEEIEVKVDECWLENKLESVEIYCSNSKVLKFINSNLTLNAVTASIETEVYFAEKCVSRNNGVVCNEFSNPRHVYIIEKYNKQDIVVKLVFDPGESKVEMCLPSLDNMSVFCEKKIFREKIGEEIQTCKMIINDDGILPVPDFLSDEKGKSFTKKIR